MSTLKNISLSTTPDITDVRDNFNTLNDDKLEVGNIVQGENIQITVDGKNIIISSTGGGGGTGVDGISLQYVWDGTSLGIKREDETEYTYVDLKGTGSGSSLANIFDGNADGAVRTKNCLNDYQMGQSAFAEGTWAMAKGYASHAEGNDTQAEGRYSHAEGFMTYAKGESAHTEGANTNALAPQSHAEGYNTNASGTASHAGGSNTKAVGYASTVIGKYGHGTVNTLFGVANGTVGNLKLGFEIRTDNTMWLNGVQITDGKSAYQSWLDLGNIGTEQDFINSIKGDSGINGLDGTNGINGLDGTNGRNVELRYSETYLQYRLVGDVDWVNLIQLTQPEIDLITLTNRVTVLETNQGDLTQVPTELQNKTIAEMITTNFTSVSNGKGLIANAITDKGVQTLATDTFQVMADNIGLISGGGVPVSGGIDEYTKLMLHGEDFTDSSSFPKAITNSGGIIATDGRVNNCINLSSGKLTIPMGDDCQFGSGDFTIDFWLKYSSLPSPDSTIISVGQIETSNGIYTDRGFIIGYMNLGNNQLQCYASSNGSQWDIFDSFIMGSPMLNMWVHYAIVRQGNTFYIFRYGELIGTKTSTLSFRINTDKTLLINRGWKVAESRQPIRIDEFRVSKGIARWTENFNPPNKPYTTN